MYRDTMYSSGPSYPSASVTPSRPGLYEKDTYQLRSDWFEGVTGFESYSLPRAEKRRSRLMEGLSYLPGGRSRADWRRSVHDPTEMETAGLVPTQEPKTPNYRTQDFGSSPPHYVSPPQNASPSHNAREHPHLQNIRHRFGLAPLAPIHDDHNRAEYADLFWVRLRLAFREPFLEFFGTFIFILIALGSVAQVKLSDDDDGTYSNICWGFGIGLMLGCYVAGDSGGFLNPAVTLTACIFRRIPWRRFPIYVAAQLLGGFCAAAVVYGNYITAINEYEGGVGIRTVPPATNATAGIFATYPESFTSVTARFFSEFLASALLMFMIFALQDESKNLSGAKWGSNFFPLGLFFTMFAIAACFGWQTGFAMNMARDFAPRLLTYAVGYKGVWEAYDYYFWIPMVSPFFGCVFGGVLYDLFLYTGPSPINSPYLGLRHVRHPRQHLLARVEAHRKDGMV